jgi:hypothetical protein
MSGFDWRRKIVAMGSLCVTSGAELPIPSAELTYRRGVQLRRQISGIPSPMHSLTSTILVRQSGSWRAHSACQSTPATSSLIATPNPLAILHNVSTFITTYPRSMLDRCPLETPHAFSNASSDFPCSSRKSRIREPIFLANGSAFFRVGKTCSSVKCAAHRLRPDAPQDKGCAALLSRRIQSDELLKNVAAENWMLLFGEGPLRKAQGIDCESQHTRCAENRFYVAGVPRAPLRNFLGQ